MDRFRLQSLAAGLLLAPLSRAQGQEPTVEERLRAAEERIRRLERELGAQRTPETAPRSGLDEALDRLLAKPSEAPGAGPAAPQASSLLNPRISVDLLFDAAAFSREDPGLFGGHDPVPRGFKITNLEFVFENAVDPYFDLTVIPVMSVEEGETGLELEEAYGKTRALPGNLRLLAGEWFTHFGRHNSMHAHAWEFSTIPLFLPRFFGPDGFRNPGLELSWIAPTSFFLEGLASLQQADGENGRSFSFEPTDDPTDPTQTLGGHSLLDEDVEGVRDLATTLRLSASTDLSETTTLLGGVSAMFGDNATGPHERTAIYGADLYLRWKPIEARRGFPFVSWQTEAAWRDLEAAADPSTGAPDETLDDFGGYSQVVWGFFDRWTAGGRVDYANGDGGLARSDDPLRDRRARGALALTWYPTEFSKLRFEYGLDRAAHLDDRLVSSFVLQLEFLIGTHAAHKF
ncbi:MAG: TonB-dependent receptor [Planctomycetes bacterium]|nr:TonB-dependent receptor [Planctomycetota bacterium]